MYHRFSNKVTSAPAGYATTYTVKGASTDFSFITIRLAGQSTTLFNSTPLFFKMVPNIAI